MQKNANEIWNYHYFVLIYEYELCSKYRLLPLPSPLNLIDFCLVFLKFLIETIRDLKCVNEKELNNIESQIESDNENSPEKTANAHSVDNGDNEDPSNKLNSDKIFLGIRIKRRLKELSADNSENEDEESNNLNFGDDLRNFNRRLASSLTSSLKLRRKILFPQPPDNLKDCDKQAILGR